jgi:hypothetical protein
MGHRGTAPGDRPGYPRHLEFTRSNREWPWSLSEGRATATDLLGHLRDHWKIENELHYVRDVTFKEDACRVRSGTAPQVLAALRNAVVHLLSQIPAKSYPEALEHLQIHPAEARQLIGIPQSE